MKTMTKILLAVGVTIVTAVVMVICVMSDWHFVIIREKPTLFFTLFLWGLVTSGLCGGWMLSSRWVYKVVFLGAFIVSVFLFSFSKYQKEARVIVYRNAAEHGDANAKYELGQKYEYGCFEVEQNKAEAVNWYSKAATLGHADAQYELGDCYAKGNGVETNKVEAVRWYRKAAEQGHAGAQGRLGMCYANGDGVETNKAEAVKWCRKAAEQGEGHAQFMLGMFYYFGDGVNQNKEEATNWFDAIQEQYPLMQYAWGCNFLEVKGIAPEFTKEAVKWFRKAAEQGEAHAQFMLGMCYFNGVGITQDKTEAVKWLQKAAKRGHEEAKKALTKINNPEKPACPSDLLEPQSDRQDKTIPKVVTLGQTNTIRDVRQDKTLRATRAAALYAGAMRGKTPRARAGKGLLGIVALGLGAWLDHEAERLRKEEERLDEEIERLDEERWNEIRRKLK